MNAADVLTAILFAIDKGEDPALILDENSPLIDAARDALKPRSPQDATECARSPMVLANWSDAPFRSRCGVGMMIADVIPTKDETMTVFVHRDTLTEFVNAREELQRERINARFAGRAKTPATADFDLPAPND